MIMDMEKESIVRNIQIRPIERWSVPPLAITKKTPANATIDPIKNLFVNLSLRKTAAKRAVVIGARASINAEVVG